MSDTSAQSASAASAAPKASARPAAEIRADIEKERAALADSFGELRHGLDEALDAGARRAREAGRRAAVIGPAVAGAVAFLLVVRWLFRHRARSGGAG